MWRGRNKSVEDLYAIKVKLFSNKKDCYNCKRFYVSPIVTTKKILMEDTQNKIRKESKHTTTKKKKKSMINTNEDSKRIKEGQKSDKTEKNLKMAKVSFSL